MPEVISLGFFTSKSGKLYHLLYFPAKRKGQALGPLPLGLKREVSGIALEVEAESGKEAMVLLHEGLK